LNRSNEGFAQTVPQCGGSIAAVVVEEEASVDSSSGNRQSAASTVATDRVDSGGELESGGDLESFGMKSKMTWDGLLFIGSKISAVVLV
jgi:hypothetical protein